ncbi:hypothetical protein EB796_011245 [Bugula neritina]|uniref:Uncharacterized protein n=1 Tax=Bugula neritina TaxID=10212 RepID=A0A7J7JXF2_BUGNE|nr:hypothetical protein EB796_011245 [Bugula neritina]
MPSIRKLCLSDNNLVDALPSGFGEGCPLLEHLDLSGNILSSLPDDIDDLKKLHFLDMGSILPELERKVDLLNGNN